MTVEVRVRPSLRDVKKRLDKARADIGNTTPPMKAAAVFLDQWVQHNFREQGARSMGGWAPLAAGGRWRGKGDRRRLDTSAKILQDTGRLRLSFVPFATRKNAGIGSELPYAKHHEKGEGRLPERRMLPEHKQVRGEIVTRIRKWAKTVAKNA